MNAGDNLFHSLLFQAQQFPQARAGAEVAGHFAIEPDGSFTIDTALFELERA